MVILFYKMPFKKCGSGFSCRIGCMRNIRQTQKALAWSPGSWSKAVSKGHPCTVFFALVQYSLPRRV